LSSSKGVIASLVLLLVAGASPKQITLAAPDFRSVKVDPAMSGFCSEHFNQRIDDRGLHVVTQRKISMLLGIERQRQLLGCSDDGASACTIELGNALGADGVVLGDLAELGGEFVINVHVMRASDGANLASTSIRAKGEGQLIDALNRGADEVADQLFAKFGLPASPPVGLRHYTWVPAGVGVLGVVTAGIFLALAADVHSQLNATGGPQLDAAVYQSRGQTDLGVFWAAGGVGIAALLTAAGFYLFGAPPAVQPQVTLGSGGAGIGISGAWP